MKRIGHLFEKVVEFDHLIAAARRAMRGCGKTAAACRFHYRLETEVLKLQREILRQTYRPQPYRFFTIRDAKRRTIAVAPFRDRVVHHAVVDVMMAVYEGVFIHDSYATRPHKGTHAAVLRAQRFSRRRSWYLKADIAKYFDSVDHAILLSIVRRKIKDRRLLTLLERIIENSPVPGKGLPIGNLTSQFLANVYLDPLDHALKDELGIKEYIRYMDDFLVFAANRSELTDILQFMEATLNSRLGLSLKPRATTINRTRAGISFLGMRIFPRWIRVRPENRRRCLRRAGRKIRAWRRGELEEEKMVEGLQSTVAHLKYFCPCAGIAEALDSRAESFAGGRPKAG